MAISISLYVSYSYVFEIYQSPPNDSVNHGLIVPETNILNLNCAPWGEWSPKEVPRCIRKNTL